VTTGISWTEETWNPATGCDRVSPGCDHCYAMTMAKRLKGMGQAKYQRDGDPRTSGPGFGLTVHPDALSLPLHWRKPRKVFVNSMSDLFHADVPDGFIARVFAVMAATPQHTYQILTKRHARMRSVLNDRLWWQYEFAAACRVAGADYASSAVWSGDIAYLPNVHLGISAEDEKRFDLRSLALLDTRAAVRFISAEPLIGQIRMRASLLVGRALDPPDGIGWVIAGGESGPGARPCELDWLRSLRDQCADAGVPFFCKQLGAVLGRQFDAGPHGADWDHWPEDLRVRQFPAAAEPVPA
jgi:protein gp37